VKRDLLWLLVIVLLAAGSVYVLLDESRPIQRGLDLQGGLQVLLEADVPADTVIEAGQMDTVRQIIGQRVNGLGVIEPLVQVEGDRRILVELPGASDPEQAIELIQGTALLEFVDSGQQPLPAGMCVRTSHDSGASNCESEQPLAEAPLFETVLTGSGLDNASVSTNTFGQYYVAFDLRPDAADIFEQYTASHQGQFLTIVLDKVVISSPRINSVISDSGSITGEFTLEEAQQLALQLSYGSLPVPLRIESSREIGATLGESSVNASIRAGAIGVSVVLLFMLVYYRLPGALANLALILYALLNLAVFKSMSVTLTMPAIAGFLLSTGMAVDANILVFERMKEEIRKGGLLSESLETSFKRAWTSIRDSNVATLVICFILWSFGRNFGASMVQGFAMTLAIGVMMSMFTAVVVTRTLVRLVIGGSEKFLLKRSWLLGV